jgi:signal transduction histidine kinase
VRAYANDIHQDAERLDRAFNEMLELDRMESGRTVLQIAHVDINEVISQVLESIRRESPQRSLLLRLDDSTPAVPCDREKVAQVLTNLVGNAIKFSRKGGEIVVTSESDSEQVTVTVKDHGPGMPHDFDDRLFTGRHANGSGGTGLGLPIARQIIEMHGGRIWFDSAAAQGTEFHFTLPFRVRPSRELKAVVRT